MSTDQIHSHGRPNVAPARRSPRSWRTRALVVLVLAAGLVALVASPASAHAELIQSDPAPGAVLTRAPSSVSLRFSESVEVQTGGVRVFDADGQRVDEGGVDASARTVTLPLPDLGNGAYVVTWRVTSSDSHPVRGAFTFQVGQGGAGATSRQVQGLAKRLLAAEGGDPIVGVLAGIARFFVFAGLALLIGGAFFVTVVWPPARASKAARWVVQGGWIAVFAATVAGLLLYGPYGEGLGVGDVFTPSLIGDTLGTRFGQVWLLRVIVLLAMVPLLRVLFRRSTTPADASDPDAAQPEVARDPAPERESTEARPGLPRWWAVAMVVGAVLLALTPGLAGHATTGDWATAAIFADTIHVLAMAVWLGGLVVLAIVGLSRRATLSARDAVEQFSRVALACIIALIFTGAFQTWRQVGSLEALRSTDYGRILVVKLVLVAVVIVFAAFSREVVLRILPPPPLEPAGGVRVVAGGSDNDDQLDDDEEYEVDEEVELRRLRRSVWAEIATAALILVATTLLVNAAPAKSAVATAGGGVAGITLEGKGVNVDVTLTPAAAGRNDVHVDTSDSSGAPKNVQDLTVTFALPSRGIAPIDVPLRRLGPGHYYSPGFEVPISGEWRVRAKPLLSEFDEQTLRGSITVG